MRNFLNAIKGCLMLRSAREDASRSTRGAQS
jgi:hypothetical protein